MEPSTATTSSETSPLSAEGEASSAEGRHVPTQVHTLGLHPLTRLFENRFGVKETRHEPQLESVFRNILAAANQYAPAESGSIALVERDADGDRLVFVASFGEGSQQLVGTRLRADLGIMGRVYRNIVPVVSNDVANEPSFYPGIDVLTSSTTLSMMSIPIVLDKQAVGVLTLRNRLARSGFKPQEMRLMQIFCHYLSTSIQNLVDFLYHRELALRDHLTGLRNDRFFYAQLTREIEGCERYGGHLSLVFLDLDHFKNVVDAHGHLVGSRVIAEVGQMLARVVDHPGATLARYGGDEYVILLPGLSREQAAEVAERIRQRVREGTYLTEPMADGSPPLSLKDCFTASIGVASYADCLGQELSADAKRHAFIRKADEAMYQAKAGGKDRVFVHRADRA